MNKNGEIVSVNISSKGGVPKYPQSDVYIDNYGISGDYHSGKFNKHKKNQEFNIRPITIVAFEVLKEINNLLCINLKPGDLAENITINGSGDLSDLNLGDTIEIEDEVILYITGQNDPCSVLNIYHELALKSFINKRGVIATIMKAGTVKPGDTYRIIKGNS